MAVTVTIEEVKASFSTDVADPEITLAIDLVSQADECLDRYQVAEAVQKALKLYAIRHALFMQANSGQGALTSQSAPSGASRSFGRWAGRGGSPYWGLLEQTDQTGCLIRLLRKRPNLGAWTVGSGE
jgi:hypothetical protein